MTGTCQNGEKIVLVMKHKINIKYYFLGVVIRALLAADTSP